MLCCCCWCGCCVVLCSFYSLISCVVRNTLRIEQYTSCQEHVIFKKFPSILWVKCEHMACVGVCVCVCVYEWYVQEYGGWWSWWMEVESRMVSANGVFASICTNAHWISIFSAPLLSIYRHSWQFRFVSISRLCLSWSSDFRLNWKLHFIAFDASNKWQRFGRQRKDISFQIHQVWVDRQYTTNNHLVSTQLNVRLFSNTEVVALNVICTEWHEMWHAKEERALVFLKELCEKPNTRQTPWHFSF